MNIITQKNKIGIDKEFSSSHLIAALAPYLPLLAPHTIMDFDKIKNIPGSSDADSESLGFIAEYLGSSFL